jgi:hypothetical protein
LGWKVIAILVLVSVEAVPFFTSRMSPAANVVFESVIEPEEVVPS